MNVKSMRKSEMKCTFDNQNEGECRPIGIFWDIENCQVSRDRSVIKLVQKLRKFIVEKGYRESEFLVVCDTHKQCHDLLDDLNSAQVTVIHVKSTAKNAADDKLKQLITRFIASQRYRSALLVLSDDINFACVLSDLRNREGIDVILFQREASPALLACANIVENFIEFCSDLPFRIPLKLKEPLILVKNIPTDRKQREIKSRLNTLVTNCGGKVHLTRPHNSEAIIRFACYDDAKRALNRINNQDVFGHKIIPQLIINQIEGTQEINDSKAKLQSEHNSDSDISEYKEDLELETKIIMTAIISRIHRNSVIAQNGQNNDLTYCPQHSCPNKANVWVDYLGSNKPLPMVNMPLTAFSSQVHHLLDTHGGALPLSSFIECYLSEFKEPFNTRDENLISLEHLITCVPGVSISNEDHIKRITWLQNNDSDPEVSLHSLRSSEMAVMTAKILHFSKEVRELLKSQSHAIIPFNKFVPAYHTHFVKQLCVSSFGLIKLSELLARIPHIVQIYGENDGRMITLTHREQAKRFATDLIKILKAQIGRQLKLSQFASAYQMTFNRTFDITDYGVCYIEDILKDVWEGTVIIKPYGSDDKLIEMPARERSRDQMKRTNAFGQEVVQLLSTFSKFELSFSKFIPSYHHYYNKQCRVLDFGFIKLIELLEALCPDYIEIEDGNEFSEKTIRLNKDKRVAQILNRLETVLKTTPSHTASIIELERLYQRRYKTKIDFIDFSANDLTDFLQKLPKNRLQISRLKNTTLVSLINKQCLREIGDKIIRILMEQINVEMDISQLEDRFLKDFKLCLGQLLFNKEYEDYFDVNTARNSIKLKPMYEFARDCIQIMQSHPTEKYTLKELESALTKRKKGPLPQPYNYKCTSFTDLFRNLSDYFETEKKGKAGAFNLLISLSHNLRKNPLTIQSQRITILRRSQLVNGTAHPVVDKVKNIDELLCDDIPGDIPPPLLAPKQVEIKRDLIRWSPEPDDRLDLQSNPRNKIAKKSRIIANFS